MLTLTKIPPLAWMPLVSTAPLHAAGIVSAWNGVPAAPHQNWLFDRIRMASPVRDAGTTHPDIAAIAAHLSVDEIAQAWKLLKPHAIRVGFSPANIREALLPLRYQDYVSRLGEKVIEALLDPDKDRGLLVSPIASRDVVEDVLLQLLSGDEFTLPKKVLLVVRGKINMERWRKRLEKVFDDPRQLGMHNKDVWSKDGVVVNLAQIDTLSRMEDEDLRLKLQRSDLLIMDEEHRVRPFNANNVQKRFINLLIQGGWLNEDFQAVSRSKGRFYLGITEAVTSGASSIYRFGDDLIHADSLSSLYAACIVRTAQVKVMLPHDHVEGEKVSVAWKHLSPDARVHYLYELLLATVKERGEIPRSIFYMSTRDEARAFAELLKEDESLRAQVALVISGEEEAVNDLRAFTRGLRKLVITVDVLAGGADEFLKTPADIAFFAHAGSVGSLRKALQIVGDHLATSANTEFVDLADMFFTHPDLAVFSPRTYVLEDETLQPIGIGNEIVLRKRRLPVEEHLAGTEYFLADFFGEDSAVHVQNILGSFAVSSAELALKLNRDEVLLAQVLAGKYLPADKNFLLEIASVLNFTESQVDWLILAWARDHAARFARGSPFPHSLSQEERFVLERARIGFYYHFNGARNAVEGMGPEVLKSYLSTGFTLDSGTRESRTFYMALAKLLAGNEDGERGLEVLAHYLGAERVGYFWHPKTTDDFTRMKKEQVKTWFDAVYKMGNYNPAVPQTFMVQMLRDSSDEAHLFRAPRVFRLSDAEQMAKSRSITKLTITRYPNGNFLLEDATGSGSPDIAIAWGQKTSQGLLLSKKLKAKKKPSKPWTNEMFAQLDAKQLQTWYEDVYPNAAKESSGEILIELTKRGQVYYGVAAFAPGSAELNSGRLYSQIKFRRKTDGTFELVDLPDRNVRSILDLWRKKLPESFTVSAEVRKKHFS